MKKLADLEELGAYLREQRLGARLSLRQLASVAGVSNPYLSQVERGLRKPSVEVLQQIAHGLRISAGALYIRAGILDPESVPDFEAAVAADRKLNDRQRGALLDIYASFVAENLRASSDLESAMQAEVALPKQIVPAAATAKAAVKKATAKKATAKKSASSTAKSAVKKAAVAKSTTKKAVKAAPKKAAVRPRGSRRVSDPEES